MVIDLCITYTEVLAVVGGSSDWLLVGTPSAIRPELGSKWAEHSLPIRMSLYIFLIYKIFITYAVCVSIFMTSLLGVDVGLSARNYSLHRETILSLIQVIVSSLGEQIFIRKKTETVMRITVCICAPYSCRVQMEIKERWGQTRVF